MPRVYAARFEMVFSSNSLIISADILHNYVVIFQFFIDPYKLLPLQRFLEKPRGRGGAKRGGPGGKKYVNMYIV